ncbi:MAG: hypothetical protein HY690_17770 [Chloroflexi bacterium]|nr:hypothetical protein [Chloroflexota bacterium]
MSEYLATGQAARALGGSIHAARNCVTSGQLPAARFDSRTLVHRDAILRTLEELAKARPSAPAASGSDRERAAQRRQFVRAQLPADHLTRLEALHAKLEAGDRLSGEERAEMRRIEQRGLEVAGEKVDEWTARAASS